MGLSDREYMKHEPIKPFHRELPVKNTIPQYLPNSGTLESENEDFLSKIKRLYKRIMRKVK